MTVASEFFFFFNSQVVQPPTDSVSSLSFSPKGNYLVATSWDNQVSVVLSFSWSGGFYGSVYLLIELA